MAADLDDIFAGAQIDGFVENTAKTLSQRWGKSRELITDRFDLQSLWGVTAAQTDLFAAYALQGGEFAPATGRRDFEGNIWHKLIKHPWYNCYEELSAVFMGAVQIAHYNESDNAYYTLFHPLRTDPAPNMVYSWSHEGYTIGEVTARTLDYFALQSAVQVARESRRVSKEGARSVLNKLAQRYLQDFEEINGEEPESGEPELNEDEGNFWQEDLDQDFNLTSYYWRARWIIQLLSPESTHDWQRDVKESFHPSMNKVYDDADYRKRLDFGVQVPPTALYMLWRMFWCDEKERLAECCTAYRNHTAPIVRDLVELMDELANGCNEIGPLKDIRAVRKRFNELVLFEQSSP